MAGAGSERPGNIEAVLDGLTGVCCDKVFFLSDVAGPPGRGTMADVGIGSGHV